MSLSRRELIKLLAGATAAAAGLMDDFLLPAQAHKREAAVQETAPTALPTEMLAALMSMVPALFIMNPPQQVNHYEQMLRVRAEQRPGDLRRYSEAATELNRRAQEQMGSAFEALDIPTRRALLQNDIDNLIANDNAGRDEGNEVGETMHDLLTCYLYTDAYVAIGYDAWPGIPRGLEAYRQPLGAPE
jgi:hypothetical protein